MASELSGGNGNSGTPSEASASQMKSCKNAVAEEFTMASMADISVSPGPVEKHGKAEVRWTTDLDGGRSHGICKVAADGEVLKVKTKRHHSGRHGSGELEMDGFYYDKHVEKWRDPAGDICHTCTPENGFPKP